MVEFWQVKIDKKNMYNHLSNNTRQFCVHAGFANERAKQVS